MGRHCKGWIARHVSDAGETIIGESEGRFPGPCYFIETPDLARRWFYRESEARDSPFWQGGPT